MSIKVGSYAHLPPRDQLAMLRLLCLLDGLETLRSFERVIATALPQPPAAPPSGPSNGEVSR